MGVLVTGANPDEETRLKRRGNRIPGSIPPGAPVRGDIWYDTGTLNLKVWNGTAWAVIGSAGVVLSGGDLTLTGKLTADRIKISPDDVDDAKIDLYGGSYLIGVRSSTMYFNSGGGSFSFDKIPNGYAFRYGAVVNGTETGLKVEGNVQGIEVYADNWFRNRSQSTGWYSNWAGYGLWQTTAGWIHGYQNPNFHTDGWVSGGSLAGNGLIRVRAYTDTCHQIAYITPNIGSPANGTQSIDGPMMSGYNAAALGSAPCRFNNIQFRAWDNGGDFRSDHYSPVHCLQGLFVDAGTKSFLIDHPVLGTDYHLQYTAIEGPSVDLIWRGKITLKNGKGTINLDDEVGQTEGTFEALTFPEDRQFFLYNETGDANPHGKWVPGAGDIDITCADKTATIGWMVIAVRKAGLDSGHGLTEDGKLMVEWKKTEIEKSTTKKQTPQESLDEMIAELENWKEALPGSERKFDQLIQERKDQTNLLIEGRKEHHANMAVKRDFWKTQKSKAQKRKKDKGR